MPEPFSITMATLLASDLFNKMISKQEETNKLIKEQLARLEENEPWLNTYTLRPVPDVVTIVNFTGKKHPKYIGLTWSDRSGGAGLPTYPFYVKFGPRVFRGEGGFDWSGETPAGTARLPLPPGANISSISFLVLGRSLNITVWTTNNRDLLPY